MGAPACPGTPRGLAFETWDPSNQFPLETHTRLFVIRGEEFGNLAAIGMSSEISFENSTRNSSSSPAGSREDNRWVNAERIEVTGGYV